MDGSVYISNCEKLNAPKLINTRISVKSLAVYSTKIFKRNLYEINKETTENFFDRKPQTDTCAMHKIPDNRKLQLDNNSFLRQEMVLVEWSR